ncbi:MAG: hypothetical protein COB46_07610 [Rhodospirillaceae bacterium]|nr:MAG: hypothetical protein COB46_07610 [Rhodospirillaceae bacterium]
MAQAPRIPVVKLIIWCLVIGFALSFFNTTPENVYAWAGETGKSIFEWFLSVGERIGPFVLMGAILVLPIWGISYLWRWMKTKRS